MLARGAETATSPTPASNIFFYFHPCISDCTVQSNCTAQRGACRQNCLSGESELANGCVGFNCKCCVPANETCPTDPNTCKGKCIDERLCGTSDRIANSSCVGEFCTCCTGEFQIVSNCFVFPLHIHPVRYCLQSVSQGIGMLTKTATLVITVPCHMKL